ncbi:MAG: endonuclease III, partial [Erysipelotrichia bacterium]|nr:endonuclease III [Erysipelotrichia bacterium]
MDTNDILDEMKKMFPNAECALHHRNAYELIVAVVLSAQTTDEAVNKITPALFERYPSVYDLANGEVKEIATYLKTIGLYRNKSRMIHELANAIVNDYDGEVPNTRKKLTSLAGVGRKTANVVLSVWFHVPAFAVDTHVERVSKRLGLAKFKDSVEVVETKLKRKIDRERWNEGHHLFIFFGRYHC